MRRYVQLATLTFRQCARERWLDVSIRTPSLLCNLAYAGLVLLLGLSDLRATTRKAGSDAQNRRRVFIDTRDNEDLTAEHRLNRCSQSIFDCKSQFID